MALVHFSYLTHKNRLATSMGANDLTKVRLLCLQMFMRIWGENFFSDIDIFSNFGFCGNTCLMQKKQKQKQVSKRPR